MLKALSETNFTGFCTSHSKVLMSSFINKAGVKYFHITENTKKRIKNVPTEKIKGGKLIGLKQDKGIVYFNDGLHFMYLIRKNGVYIMTSKLRSKKQVDDPIFYTGQMMDGFLYFDFLADSSSCYINNPLDILHNKSSGLKKEREVLNIISKMQKEMKRGITDTLEKYKGDYETKWDNTRLCLQAFMFIHFAKIINSTKISQDGEKLTFSDRMKKKKQSSIDIIQVDTFYDESMKVINPFSVMGHFRNQPYGKDRLKRKTIYIDGFMKDGYERKATKLKINK